VLRRSRAIIMLFYNPTILKDSGKGSLFKK
jgi:hypothetical protein